MKKLLSLALTAMLVCALGLPAMGKAFPDVPEHHWAYKAVEELYAAGLVIGYPDGTFGGQRSLTRYEYAMIVSRLYQRLQEIAAEGSLQADKALEAAMAAQEMAKQAQLAADAAVKATPVERIIEKHIIETKPDIPYEEVYRQARDLAVLVEALQEEFAAEIAELQKRTDLLEREVNALDSRLTGLEVKVGDLDARQTRTEADVAQIKSDVAQLKAEHEKFKVGGTAEVKVESRDVGGNLQIAFKDGNLKIAFKDPYKPDFDGDGLRNKVNHPDPSLPPSTVNDTDDYYTDGVTLQNALTVNVGFVPVKGVDVQAKVQLTDAFRQDNDRGAKNLDLRDIAIEATSDGFIRRAYYGNVDSYKAFDGYSRFIKTRTEFIEERETGPNALGSSVAIEGAQVDFAGSNIGGQFAVLGNPYELDYYTLSRIEYTVSPVFALGVNAIRTQDAQSVSAVTRYGGYAKGKYADINYLLGVYNSDEKNNTAIEVSASRPFRISNVGVNVGFDYTRDYDDKDYTLVAVKTSENILVGSIPLALSGEVGTSSKEETHLKAAINVVDLKVGLLNVNAGIERVNKDTSKDSFEVAAWTKTSPDYTKFSLNAGTEFAVGAVKLTPAVEVFTKQVTENDPDAVEAKHTDNRVTGKIGFATKAFDKGALNGTVKLIRDTAYNSGNDYGKPGMVESKAFGADINLTYPVGAVNLTVGGEYLKYEETKGEKYGDYDYLILKSGVKFDF